MNLFQTIILIGLLGNTALGLFVLLSNPRRAVNVSFFALTIFIVFWLGSMFFCSLQRTEPVVLFWVRQTSAFAALLPIGIFLVHLAIVFPELTWLVALRKLRLWLLASFSMVVLCHSSVFALFARTPTETELVPPTDYGWGFSLYMVFFVLVIIILSVCFWRAAKSRVGVQKAEIQFLQIDSF